MTYSSFIRTHVICHVLLISTITILSIEALVDFNVLQCLSFGQCDLSVPSLYVTSVGNVL